MPAEFERPTLGSGALDEIRARFAASEAELATMLAVKRPAIAEWRIRGVPVDRRADVERVLELARYFHRKVRSRRVPRIVRTPGKGLGGITVLETIASHGALPVFDYLEELFSYIPR